MRKPFRFKTLKKSVSLVVKTKSPSKWLLIDRETGQMFQGSESGYWDRLDPKIKINKEEE
jgi:hypothetical protein